MSKARTIFYCCVFFLYSTNSAHSENAPEPLIDPTIIEESTEEILNLSGITYTGHKYFCIINNQVLERNDRLGKFIVDSITHNKVFLKDAHGKLLELHFNLN